MVVGARAILALARAQISAVAGYRLSFLAAWLGSVATLAVAQVAVWLAAFRDLPSGATFAGFARGELLAYALLAPALRGFASSSSLQRMVSAEIADGTISQALLLPIGYMRQKFAQWVAQRVVALIPLAIYAAGVLLLLSALALAPEDTRVASSGIVRPSLVPTIGVIAVMIVLSFLMDWLFGILTFWTEQSNGFASVKGLVTTVVSGTLFPLDLLPINVRHALDVTPFPYLTYYPTLVLCGNISSTEATRLLAGGLGWCAVMGIIAGWAWRRGLNRFTGVGM